VSIAELPALNACLNATSAILLGLGFVFIRRGNRHAHRACMIAAVVVSVAFLASYLTYHAFAGRTVFRNPPWFRPIYLVILLTHTVLAVGILPLVGMTLSRAWRERFDAHRRIARWTLPLWMYVSVTGVVIYLLLYRIFPNQ